MRIPKQLRELMNGHMYGWVDKKDCVLLKGLPTEYRLTTIEGKPAFIAIDYVEE